MKRHPTRLVGTWLRAGIAAAVAVTVLLCSVARGQNGALLQTLPGLNDQDLIDLCVDSTDGSFWAASKTKGTIHHIGSNFLVLAADEITNPFGATGIFSPFFRTQGIAFRSDSETLLILGQRTEVQTGVVVTYEMREVQQDGTEIPTSTVAVTPPQPTEELVGLAWDPLTSSVWYLDAGNDLLVRSDLQGNAVHSFSLPGDVPTETRIFGKGVDFELHPSGLTGFLNVSYGDVFTLGPSRIERLTISGLTTGASIPLPLEIGDDVLGFVVLGTTAVVIDGDSNLRVLGRQIDSPLPPSDLKCLMNEDNEVQLEWQNNGLLGPYSAGIQILRDGVFLQNIGGNSTGFTDSNPPLGRVTYSIVGLEQGGQSSVPANCSVRTGRGGLLRWRPFPGKRIFDVCRDPANGDLYFTDNPISGTGSIWRFDKNLVPYADEPARPNPMPSPVGEPGGIAFWPAGDGGAGSLMVARQDGVLMREVSLSGDPIDAGIPMNPPSQQNVVSGMSYDPAQGLFSYIDADSVVFVDQNGSVSSTVTPPEFLLGPINLGLSFDSSNDVVFASFQRDDDDGAANVQAVFTSGTPAEFTIELDALGESTRVPNGIGGLQVAENRLLVCSVAANAIFELLLAATGDFVRGDSNSSGVVDMSDAVFTAEYLFADGPAPQCPDAADANDDGLIDVSDPVFELFHLFLSGSPPPAPFPGAGRDPTFLDSLDC